MGILKMQKVKTLFGQSGLRVVRTSLLFVATAAAGVAGQSISLRNTTATFRIPTTPAFAALASTGSYWLDVRVTDWGYPEIGRAHV